MKMYLGMMIAAMALVQTAKADDTTNLVCRKADGTTVLSIKDDVAVTQGEAELGLGTRTTTQVISMKSHDRSRGYGGGGSLVSSEIYVEVSNGKGVHQLLWLIKLAPNETEYNLRRVDDETKADDGTNVLETQELIPCAIQSVKWTF